MELPGAGYFYTLATLGITFAGFAALLIVVRQTLGTGLSKFHLWVSQSYVKAGLVTSANSMIPPLLFGAGLPEELIWRVSSAFVATQSLYLLAMAPREWRRATKRRLLPRVKAQIVAGILVNVALLLNAAGWPFPPKPGLLMLAISANLFAFFAQFAESLRYFFEEQEEEFEATKAATRSDAA